MKARDIKYLLAYIIPFVTLLSLQYRGFFSFSTVVLAFIIIPFIELYTPQFTSNYGVEEQIKRDKFNYFDILLTINVLWVYTILYLFFKTISESSLEIYEIIGLTVSTGIMLGSNGINVAHELGHKKGLFSQVLAKILLWPTLYLHFTTEHNKGHHVKVGTPEDPATSRLGENVYFFWFRSVSMSFISAWKIRKWEKNNNISLYTFLLHPIFEFVILPLLYLSLVNYFFGTLAFSVAVLAAITSILLLETINYIEHYGLIRNKSHNGRYQPVETFHSWNSNHEIGRIVLYELTRHSDHHYKANKKYQNLDHHDESPQLPYGYPTSILLALFPPLWFTIMNPLVEKWRVKNLNI